jgi:hypothetical protein
MSLTYFTASLCKLRMTSFNNKTVIRTTNTHPSCSMNGTAGDNDHGEIVQRQVDEKIVETCVRGHYGVEY